jgi:hypothetical protein
MWFVAFSTCKNDASSGLMRSIEDLPVKSAEGTATAYLLPPPPEPAPGRRC